ncbi:hypothetical protein LCGC14_1784540 [marine sediment metagenome]|uniref:Uncharacterized protein n=1 Tax=marine sediment metagenome TaxID=412755 RepID=A0A0F9GUI1_9ZZZZ
MERGGGSPWGYVLNDAVDPPGVFVVSLNYVFQLLGGSIPWTPFESVVPEGAFRWVILYDHNVDRAVGITLSKQLRFYSFGPEKSLHHFGLLFVDLFLDSRLLKNVTNDLVAVVLCLGRTLYVYGIHGSHLVRFPSDAQKEVRVKVDDLFDVLLMSDVQESTAFASTRSRNLGEKDSAAVG